MRSSRSSIDSARLTALPRPVVGSGTDCRVKIASIAAMDDAPATGAGACASEFFSTANEELCPPARDARVTEDVPAELVALTFIEDPERSPGAILGFHG